jgi:hypothetical protein
MLDSAHAKLSLLIFVLLSGTARASTEMSTVSAVAEPTPVEGGRVALESRPSAAAASLLPEGARYRLVTTPEEIALLVMGPDNRISGRVRIRPLGRDRVDASYGATIIIDDFGGPDATIDTWSSAGGLSGKLRVGNRRASWRVRVEPDGSLVGERWSVRHGPRSLELAELRRARAIGADIAALCRELVSSGALAPEMANELTELVVLAELALDLSVRAWDGRGRASLPRVSSEGVEP